jgi:malate synthase
MPRFDAPDVLRPIARRFCEDLEQVVKKSANQAEMERLLLAALGQVLSDAYIQGVKRYAHWKDGRETVGTIGKTFGQAVAEIRLEMSPPAWPSGIDALAPEDAPS